MASVTDEIKCPICGAVCAPCECAPCPTCVGILCSSCPIPRPIWDGQSVYGIEIGYKRDEPLPPRSKPCPEARAEKSIPIEVVPEPTQRWRRDLSSEQLIPDDARIVAGALARIFGFACAGVVAGAAVVMMAAAAVFSGELPE